MGGALFVVKHFLADKHPQGCVVLLIVHECLDKCLTLLNLLHLVLDDAHAHLPRGQKASERVQVLLLATRAPLLALRLKDVFGNVVIVFQIADFEFNLIPPPS